MYIYIYIYIINIINIVGVTNKYNLIANISHEGNYKNGHYKIHVYHKAMKQWLEIQDLIINKVMP